MTESDVGYTVFQAGDTYSWKCKICGLQDNDWEDLESCGHIAEMHVLDEHWDV